MASILVLGGYGLIGGAVMRAGLERGYRMVGFGRSEGSARAAHPDIEWRMGDLRFLAEPKDFAPYLEGIDWVVNAAGVLQSGGRDDVAATQERAIVALIDACAARGVAGFVQISAPDAARDAATEFYRTKAAADAHLAASSLRWTILRPGLVIAPDAYGGTALLRMLAGFPLVQPLAHGGAPVQCVAVADVARAAMRCIDDGDLAGRTFDLVEPEPRPLRDVVLAFRRWLGFAPPVRIVETRALAPLISGIADLAGRLGWRTPLRTTAMRAIESGVTGDPGPWREATGETLPGLDAILRALPATAQERLYARVSLAFPLLVLLLAVFWITSGAIGLVSREAAIALVAPRVGALAATLMLWGGALADFAIGAMLLTRRWFGVGLRASIGLSLAYLASGTVLTPELWLDPLGVFVKVFAVIGLSLALLAQEGER